MMHFAKPLWKPYTWIIATSCDWQLSLPVARCILRFSESKFPVSAMNWNKRHMHHLELLNNLSCGLAKTITMHLDVLYLRWICQRFRLWLPQDWRTEVAMTDYRNNGYWYDLTSTSRKAWCYCCSSSMHVKTRLTARNRNDEIQEHNRRLSATPCFCVLIMLFGEENFPFNETHKCMMIHWARENEEKGTPPVEGYYLAAHHPYTHNRGETFRRRSFV